jgi:hypothetical protein
MAFIPAPGVPVDQRTSAINSLLSYDATQPLTPLNEPSLYITDNCANLVYALSEHTGRDGQKGCTKDPIDCLGMLLVSGLAFVGHGGFDCRGGGGY